MKMAASYTKRNEQPCKILAFAFLLIGSLLNAGVKGHEEDAVTTTLLAPETTKAPESSIPQILVYPSMDPTDFDGHTMVTATTEGAVESGGVNNKDSSPTATEEKAEGETHLTVEGHTDMFNVAAETPAPVPSRGDGPGNKVLPESVPQDAVVCVTKEAVHDKNAVSLKLKSSSSCKDTKLRIESVLQELCNGECKLEIYQADNSDEILVSGQYVEADVVSMINKFNNDNIKDKTDVDQVVPHWGKKSKLVLVTLLLTGLLLAALLVAGYYLKTHRKNSKGVRLAESFQVDEENQANTLVSVAPLPQEPVDKPTANGESPPENGTNPAPTTNGHSQTQTPVADTEM
ncbi:hematopoietic progenitor cell antigen CD34 isoform X2 [Echeneis naucrates]|uniref:hematopoietic progenitor cell antigen CD34 isoform X2 n=1 Tax=Echeneis naucrates TaxID=173247 RepID=UPI00111459B4|nr:hematopoietic progenitor cell antigen CD34 isoform X2 [Echeneis naucrates]